MGEWHINGSAHVGSYAQCSGYGSDEASGLKRFWCYSDHDARDEVRTGGRLLGIEKVGGLRFVFKSGSTVVTTPFRGIETDLQYLATLGRKPETSFSLSLKVVLSHFIRPNDSPSVAEGKTYIVDDSGTKSQDYFSLKSLFPVSVPT